MRHIWCVLAATLAFTAPANAGRSGAAFLKISPSARSYALGRSNGITALGAEALGANPANLGLLPRRFQLFTSYATMLDGTRFQHVAAAFDPDYGNLDALGLSVTRLQTSDLKGADAAGNLNGNDFGGGDMAVALSGSGSLWNGARAGLSLKAVQSQIAQYRSNTALAFDAGFTYTYVGLKHPLSLGASLTNAGQPLKFLSQSDPLPAALNVGAALPLDRNFFVVELNRLIADQVTQAGLGYEYTVGYAAFRVGYLVSSQSGNLAQGDQKAGALLGGVSGGIGLKVGAVRFDYAMSQLASSDYGPTQRVSLSVQWGSKAEKGVTGREWGRSPSDWLVRASGR